MKRRLKRSPLISQEDIDAVLLRGSGISEGAFRIYDQYLKKQTVAENAAFLKNEYGIGGAYPAAWHKGKGIDESHDGKGIKISIGSISDPDVSVLLPWKEVEKRIGELIAADRYLNAKEKAAYPAYRRGLENRAARRKIADNFMSVVRDYNDYQTQVGNQGAVLNQYVLSDCASQFTMGNKKTHTLGEGTFIMPLMREALTGIISEGTHHQERAEVVFEQLGSDLAMELEPGYDEMNPPPEPAKEYRFSLGDTVYLGAQEYELLAYDDETVRLYDPAFPLFNKELTRTELDARLHENPLNDHLLQPVASFPLDESIISAPMATSVKALSTSTPISLSGISLKKTTTVHP